MKRGSRTDGVEMMKCFSGASLGEMVSVGGSVLIELNVSLADS